MDTAYCRIEKSSGYPEEDPGIDGKRKPETQADIEELNRIGALGQIGAAMDLAISTAVAGVGVIHLFEDMLRPQLDSGALEPILEPWWQRFSGPFLYYPGRRHMPAPLRAFVDFLKAGDHGVNVLRPDVERLPPCEGQQAVGERRGAGRRTHAGFYELVQTVGAIWWAATYTARVNALEQQYVTLAPLVATLAGMQTSLIDLKDDVKDIKTALRSAGQH